MSQSFLIFALPRSRTAWLATMLTSIGYDGDYCSSFCQHEWFDFDNPLPNRTHFNGASSTGAALHWEKVLKNNPDARIVTIRRKPLDAVLASYERATGLKAEDMFQTMARANVCLNAIEADTGCLSVNFNDIDDRAEEIHRWCLPGVEIDQLRLDQLKRMNIQLKPSIQLAEIAKLTKGQGRLAI